MSYLILYQISKERIIFAPEKINLHLDFMSSKWAFCYDLVLLISFHISSIYLWEFNNIDRLAKVKLTRESLKNKEAKIYKNVYV